MRAGSAGHAEPLLIGVIVRDGDSFSCFVSCQSSSEESVPSCVKTQIKENRCIFHFIFRFMTLPTNRFKILQAQNPSMTFF